MSEWLDLMLGEIARKKREREAALAEASRRGEDQRKRVQPRHDPVVATDDVGEPCLPPGA